MEGADIGPMTSQSLINPVGPLCFKGSGAVTPLRRRETVFGSELPQNIDMKNHEKRCLVFFLLRVLLCCRDFFLLGHGIFFCRTSPQMLFFLRDRYFCYLLSLRSRELFFHIFSVNFVLAVRSGSLFCSSWLLLVLLFWFLLVLPSLFFSCSFYSFTVFVLVLLLVVAVAVTVDDVAAVASAFFQLLLWCCVCNHLSAMEIQKLCSSRPCFRPRGKLG